jgi:hypothetical protein
MQEEFSCPMENNTKLLLAERRLYQLFEALKKEEAILRKYKDVINSPEFIYSSSCPQVYHFDSDLFFFS